MSKGSKYGSAANGTVFAARMKIRTAIMAVTKALIIMVYLQPSRSVATRGDCTNQSAPRNSTCAVGAQYSGSDSHLVQQA